MDAGSLKQCDLRVIADGRLHVRLAEAGREGDVLAGTVGVHDEHVGVGHPPALTQRDPVVGAGRADLEEDVAVAALAGVGGDVELEAEAGVRTFFCEGWCAFCGGEGCGALA